MPISARWPTPGVDTHVFQPLPETPDRPKTSPKILFVGRITPEKGVHILLEAFKQIAPRHPQLEMELVGSFGSLPREQLVGMSKTDQIRQLEQFYSGPDYRTHLQGILPPNCKTASATLETSRTPKRLAITNTRISWSIPRSANLLAAA